MVNLREKVNSANIEDIRLILADIDIIIDDTEHMQEGDEDTVWEGLK